MALELGVLLPTEKPVKTSVTVKHTKQQNVCLVAYLNEADIHKDIIFKFEEEIYKRV